MELQYGVHLQELFLLVKFGVSIFSHFKGGCLLLCQEFTAVICNRKSAVLGIIGNKFCFETRCFVYHLNVLQMESFKSRILFLA